MILPLLLTVIPSTLLAHKLSRLNIYTMKLARRGINVLPVEEAEFLIGVTVSDVMTRNYPTVSTEMKIPELINKLNKTGHHGLPVIDRDGRLYGMVTLSDVESRISSDIKQLTASDIATTKLITAYPDQSLSELVDHLRIGTSEIPRIPVVSRKDPTKLVGMLRRQDIIKGYAKTLATIHRTDNEDSGY